MTVIERGAETAHQILDERDPYGMELRDNAFVSIMLAEAYARGVVAGIMQAQARLDDLYTTTRAELADE
jgi:hypothetical protein